VEKSTVTIKNLDLKTPKYKVRKTNLDKLNIQLTAVQKEIIIGTLLGDSSIERAKLSHNGRLRFDQTFPSHGPYLMTLFSHFYNLSGKGPRVIFRKADKRTGKFYYQMQFKTLNYPCFNYYHDLFYKEGKKVIPFNIDELLTARSLAYWIMDDGSKPSKYQTILHTRAYKYEEVLLLTKALEVKFKLKTKLYEKIPGQWVIIIPLNQDTSLKNIVIPYMHSSMLYKI
jgi:hypothetical protein